jgi:5-formyltetrahydrofolate cyclo-ligase
VKRRGPPEPTEEQLLRLRHEAKRQLRRRIDAIRRAVPNEARALRSRKIAGHVIAHPVFDRARVLTTYVPMRGEVDPTEIVEAARRADKAIALPRLDWGDESMRFYLWAPDTPLEESGMGFLQPTKEAEEVADEAIDLVLTPALAIDERGHRLGFGKGFYDRFLARLKSAKSMALIFDFQRLAEVPITPGDVPVDFWAWDGGIDAPSAL